MNQQNFERVMNEWAVVDGLPPLPSGTSDMHVDIDGTVVSLVYDAAQTPELLHVYVDLGDAAAVSPQKLLASNIACGNGCFALDAEQGRVTYRASLALPADVSGTGVAESVVEVLDMARESIAACLQ